jgi:hypothetical protein
MLRGRLAAHLFLAVTLGLTLSLVPTASPDAQAQGDEDPDPSQDREPTFDRSASTGPLRLAAAPPPLGEILLEDSLTSPSVVPGRSICATRKNKREFVAEGYLFSVSGRCTEQSTGAEMVMPLVSGLDVPDGEVRVEYKLLSGADRARVYLYTRVSRAADNCNQGYLARMEPATGLSFFFFPGCATVSPLVERSDVQGRVAPDDWNSMSIRMDGPNFWVFHNDEMLLSVAEGSADRGSVQLRLVRTGNAADEYETAVVFRNLRITRLAQTASPQ